MSAVEQRLSALAGANFVRTERSVMKAWIRMPLTPSASRERAIDVLQERPAYAASMPAFDLLVTCRGIGASRARLILSRAGVAERKPVGELTARQVHELRRLLREPVSQVARS